MSSRSGQTVGDLLTCSPTVLLVILVVLGFTAGFFVALALDLPRGRGGGE